MDPVTAGFLMLKAAFEMVTEIVKGQPEDVKKAMWERHNAMVERILTFLKIKDAN